MITTLSNKEFDLKCAVLGSRAVTRSKTKRELSVESKILQSDKQIFIFSGEGSTGSWEEYDGKRTSLALKQKLKEERAEGDRWANAYYLYSEDCGYYTLIELWGNDYRQMHYTAVC